MIGAHELLLIVRAQNQASAALGRVANDLRRLQRMRDLRMQQATLQNKALQQTLRLQQLDAQTGTRGLAIQQARFRTQNQIVHTYERQAALEVRNTAIARGRANVDLQRLRMENRILTVEEAQGAAIAKQNKELATTRAKIASMAVPITRGAGGQFLPAAERDPGGLARQAALLGQHRAVTTRMVAERRVGRSDSEIAQRRLTEARMAESIATGKIKQMDVALKGLQATEQEQIAELGKLSGRSNQYGRRIVEINAQIKNLQYTLKSLDAREMAAGASAAQLTRHLQELQNELGIVTAREREAGAQAEIMAGQLKMTNTQLMETNRLIADQKWERIATAGRTVSHVGRVMQMTGLITTAALGYMGKAAADFSSQATRAATQARAPGASFQQTGKIAEKVQASVLKMMREFPASAEEMSNAFYEVFSGTNVQNVAQATKMIRTFNMMAVGTGTDLMTMTDAGISLFNNFGRHIDKTTGKMVGDFKTTTDAANAFLSAVRFGRMDAEQFANSLSNVLPIAKAAGLHFRDVADAMATVTRQSGARATSRDATGLARLIETFRRGPMAQGLAARGVQVNDPTTGNMRPLLQIIKDIQKRIPEATKDTTNFFKIIGNQQGTIQARRVFSFLIKDLDQYDKVSKQVNADHSELMASFRARMASPGVQWTIFTNQLKALVLTIGQGVIPALLEISAPIARLAQYIEGLSPHTKRLIGYFALMSSAGLLLVGTLGVLAGSFIAMIASARILAGWLGRGSGLRLLATDATGALTVTSALRFGIIGLIAVVGPLAVKVMGLHNTVQLLLIVFTAWQALRTAQWLMGLGSALSVVSARMSQARVQTVMTEAEFKAAQLQAAAFAAQMRMLAAIGIITIVIELIIHRKAVAKALDDVFSHIPGFEKSAAHKWLFHMSGEDVKQSRAEFEKNAKRIFAPLKPSDFKPLVNRSAIAPGVMSEHGQNVVPLGPKEVPSWLQGAKSPKPGTTSALGQGIWTQAQFMARIKQLRTFKKATEDASNLGAALAAQSKFHKALDILTAHSSALQKELINDLLNLNKTSDMMGDAAFQKEAARVDALGKAAAKTHNFVDAKKYYVALDKLNAHSTSTQQQAWQSIQETAKDSLDQTVKDNSEALQKITQNYQTMLGTLKQSFQTFQSQNAQNFGQLFQGPVMTGARMQNNIQFGGKATGQDLLADLRAQVSKFRQFRRVLTQLNKRGAPFALLMQINQAGPEALDMARALLQLDKQDFRTYTRAFNQGQSIVQQATKIDMTRQLKQWRSFGRNMARQILLGLKDEGSPTETYFRSLLTKLGVAPRVTGPGGKNEKYVQYVYHGGTMDYSTWLRKSKTHYKQHGK